jgi:general stress protein 26
MTDDATRDTIWEKVRTIETCMLATRDGDQLRARPMAAIPRTSQNVIWFFADAHDHKDDELARDPHACLAFADPASHCYVSISGRIDLVQDRAAIDDLWNDSAAHCFPKGPGDPRIILLRFTPEVGEYWDGPSGTIAAAFQFLKSAVTGQQPKAGTGGRTRLA